MDKFVKIGNNKQSPRTINRLHIWSIFSIILFDISIFLFLYLKFGPLTGSGTKEKFALLVTIWTGSTIVLGISYTATFILGILYFIYTTKSTNTIYPFLRKINAILLLLGGAGIGLFISIYLAFND